MDILFVCRDVVTGLEIIVWINFMPEEVQPYGTAYKM
jgi:hypothetical protein